MGKLHSHVGCFDAVLEQHFAGLRQQGKSGSGCHKQQNRGERLAIRGLPAGLRQPGTARKRGQIKQRGDKTRRHEADADHPANERQQLHFGPPQVNQQRG